MSGLSTAGNSLALGLKKKKEGRNTTQQDVVLVWILVWICAYKGRHGHRRAFQYPESVFRGRGRGREKGEGKRGMGKGKGEERKEKGEGSMTWAEVPATTTFLSFCFSSEKAPGLHGSAQILAGQKLCGGWTPTGQVPSPLLRACRAAGGSPTGVRSPLPGGQRDEAGCRAIVLSPGSEGVLMV